MLTPLLFKTKSVQKTFSFAHFLGNGQLFDFYIHYNICIDAGAKHPQLERVNMKDNF
jgi:hypothetical protein